MAQTYPAFFRNCITIFFVLLFTACGNNQADKAVAQAQQIQDAVETNSPGSIATTSEGYMMTATVNGKHWEASSMMPPEPAGRIVGAYKKDYIGLPYDKRDMIMSKKEKLGPDNAADVYVSGVPGGWLTTGGEMEVTKVGSNWVEGRFSISMKSTEDSRAIQVTDGFFRIPAVQ